MKKLFLLAPERPDHRLAGRIRRLAVLIAECGHSPVTVFQIKKGQKGYRCEVLKLLLSCDEVWVVQKRLTKEMREMLRIADEVGLPVRKRSCTGNWKGKR